MMRTWDDLQAPVLASGVGECRPYRQRALSEFVLRLAGPEYLRLPAGVREGVSLVPVGAFVAGVLGEEFRPPAEDVRSQNGRHPLGDLLVAYVLDEQVDVQVAIIVRDVRCARERLVDRIGGV